MGKFRNKTKDEVLHEKLNTPSYRSALSEVALALKNSDYKVGFASGIEFASKAPHNNFLWAWIQDGPRWISHFRQQHLCVLSLLPLGAEYNWKDIVPEKHSHEMQMLAEEAFVRGFYDAVKSAYHLVTLKQQERQS